MKTTRLLAIASLCIVAVAARAADDPQTGKWEMDATKSNYKTSPMPRSSSVTITPAGKDGVDLTVNQVTASGEKMTIQYSAQYDGKQNPRTEIGAGAAQGMTVSLTRIDARTAERIVYLNGKPVGSERWAISADGKTRIVTQFGTDAKGKPIDNLQHYVRK